MNSIAGQGQVYHYRPDVDLDDRAETGRVPLVVQILAIARKRKWTLIASVLAALVLGLIVTLLMTPLYTASATLEIQREGQNFTNVEGADANQPASVLDPEFYQTQSGLLQAKSLADRVATDLKLYDSYKFFSTFRSRKTADWFEDEKLISGASTREQRIREAGDILLDNLNLKNDRLSRLFTVNFTSPDPAFSKTVVDAWGVHFIQMTLDRRFETTSYARKFLEGRLSQLRARIDESERQLVAYAAREGIVNLPIGAQPTGSNGAVAVEQPLAAIDLATLNAELAQAKADRIQAESRLTSAGGSVSEALANQGISTIRATRADVAAQYAKMLEQFEPDYPPAQALKSQLAQLDRSIAQEESRVKGSLRDAYRAAVKREGELLDQVNGLKSGVLDLRRRSVQYNIIKREVDTNQQLYDGLLQRYKEIGVAGGVGANNISIVDRAELPEVPSSPKLLLNIALALLAGIALGAGIALVLEQFGDAVDDPAELPEMLGVPLLGTVPTVVGSPREILEDPKEALSEAYFSLQTNLGFATDHGFPKTLAITSSQPAEGKSITSYAIARSLARLNRRVLLVDADMRSPTVHHLLGIDGSAGLSNYLAGSDDLVRFIKPTGQKGLSALPAGPQPPSAADLLSSDRLERLIAELAAHFDHVVFDAPPVMGLADAPLLSSRVEGVAFVIQAHRTGKSVARVAVSRLLTANAHILGAIVTRFDVKRAHYGYGYNYGYGYGYGGRTEDSVEAA